MLECEISNLKKQASKGKVGLERASIRDEIQAKNKALADVNKKLGAVL
jgi:hypothetical protein